MAGLSGLIETAGSTNASPRMSVDPDAQKKHRDNMNSLWARYKLREPDFQDMMNKQKGQCLICSQDFGLVEKRAIVDHDHYTDQIRGLLCTQCNTRLGWLEKNIYRLIPYLQQR